MPIRENNNPRQPLQTRNDSVFVACGRIAKNGNGLNFSFYRDRAMDSLSPLFERAAVVGLYIGEKRNPIEGKPTHFMNAFNYDKTKKIYPVDKLIKDDYGVYVAAGGICKSGFGMKFELWDIGFNEIMKYFRRDGNLKNVVFHVNVKKFELHQRIGKDYHTHYIKMFYPNRNGNAQNSSGYKNNPPVPKEEHNNQNCNPPNLPEFVEQPSVDVDDIPF